MMELLNALEPSPGEGAPPWSKGTMPNSHGSALSFNDMRGYRKTR